MERMDILIGFDAPLFEKKLSSILSERGYNVVLITKHSKMQIREYIAMHRECKTLILKERDGTLSFLAEDFALLNDDTEDDLNIICILSEGRRGTNYMQTLYAAGITSALFPEEKNKIRPEQVAELCLKKRSRKEARKYYGIANVGVDIGMLSPEAFTMYYQALLNKENGKTLILRYLNIVGKMTPAQNEDFLDHLPDDIVEELKEYKEFYDFTDALRAQGAKVNYRRPKHLKIGRMDSGMMLLENKDASKATMPKVEKAKERTAADFDYGSDAFESLLKEIEEMEGDSEEGSIEAETLESERADASFDSYVKEMEEIYNSPDDERIGVDAFEKKKKKSGKIPIYLIVAICVGVLMLGVLGLVIYGGIRNKNLASQVQSEVVSELPPEESLNPQRTVEPLVPIEEYVADYLDTDKTVDGKEVVKIINCYPKEQFRVIFESENKQIIYIDGGASSYDVPDEDEFSLKSGEGEYVFTKKE